MTPFDLLLDADGDLLIQNGDFVIGDATMQHQQNLLLAEKGSFRHAPTVGIGLVSFLKDDNPDEMLREIRIQFSKDGMDVQQLGFENGKLKILAPYK